MGVGSVQKYDAATCCLERRRRRVVRVAWLWCRKVPESGDFEPELPIRRLENFFKPAVSGCLFRTRASAQSGTNTPGQRHFLMYKNTKSMKCRSLWPTFSLRSNSGHIHSFIPNFHVAMKVQGKITGS